MFRSLTTHPPGGWRFYQPEIEWPNDKRELRGLGIEAVIDKIVQKRKANPRFNLTTDRDEVMREVLIFTEAIVRKMPGTESYFLPGEAQAMPRSFPLARTLRRVAEAAGTAKKIGAGIGLLIDWLGDGMEPIPPEQAEARAQVCVGCPFNQPATGLQKLSGAAAEDIRLLMETRSDMKLATSVDAQLGTCQICACNLKLKIWTPMKHLLAKTPKETLARFQTDYPSCWMNER